MRKWGLRLLWFLILAAVIYGAYGLYAKWWDLDILSRPAGDIKKAITGKIQSSVESGVSSTVQKAQTTVTDFIKEKTAGVLDSLGSGLVSLANNLSPLVAGDVLPFATGSTFAVPPPTTAIIMKIDQPLTIALNSGSGYKVDWGDGEITGDDLPINQTKLLNHAWSQAGDYTVKLEITNNKILNIYSYPIRVYAQ